MALAINRNKNKVMLNKHAELVFFSIGDETLEQIEVYNYHGQLVSADPNHEKEVRRGIGSGCDLQSSD